MKMTTEQLREFTSGGDELVIGMKDAVKEAVGVEHTVSVVAIAFAEKMFEFAKEVLELREAQK